MINILDEYQVIGIVGLAKNTGKTTTLNWLIKKNQHRTIGLTSIGLDGEKMDQIHFLPKPRIMVHPEMIVATAQSCLDEAMIDYDVIQKTNLFTSIGEILVVRMKGEGYLVIAGPTTNQELSKVLKLMKNYANNILVDGAFNRMTFSNLDEIDGIILATGAAFSNVMEETVEHTKRVVDLFQLKKANVTTDPQAKMVFMTSKGVINLLDKKIASIENVLNDKENTFNQIIIKGAVSEPLINCMIQSRRRNYQLIGEDPSRFLFQSKSYKYLEHLHVELLVQKTVKLICITMNPYRPTHQSYDPLNFMNALKQKVNVEVIDVMREE